MRMLTLRTRLFTCSADSSTTSAAAPTVTSADDKHLPTNTD